MAGGQLATGTDNCLVGRCLGAHAATLDSADAVRPPRGADRVSLRTVRDRSTQWARCATKPEEAYETCTKRLKPHKAFEVPGDPYTGKKTS